MSRDKQKYLEAYIPEVKPKETPKRSGMKSDGRYAEIEAAVAALSDMMAKQNRDNLDAMYNIDMDNMSSSMRRLFRSYDDGITKAQAEIKTWADAQEAGFSAVAEWQDDTNNSISSIEGKADANAASITLLNQWKSDTSNSLSAVQTLASQNEAKITSLTNWRNTAEDDIEGLSETVAVIEQIADENGASISQIVEAVGENGEVTFASIAAGVSKDESFINLVADEIALKGFVTFESLEGDGDSVINGNNILLLLDGSDDDGYTDLESENGLGFVYRTSAGENRGFADIYTSIDGSDTNETSRYALNIVANRFDNENGEESFASLKLEAAGRISLWGQFGVYIGTDYEGYITLDTPSGYNTRIVASDSYSNAVSAVAEAANTYHFATDGIYYNGVKYAGGGSNVAVFG